MSLKGTIETFAIADVLRLLAATNKSGRLHVEGPGRTGTVWVDGGQVLSTEATNTPFVDGHNDVVFQLLRFEKGTFIFETDEEPESRGDVIPIETALVSSEAMIDEWSTVEQTVPTQDSWVSLRPSLSGDSVTLDEDKWRTVAAIGSGSSVSDIGSTLQLGELKTGRILAQLTDLDLVDIGGPETAPASSPAAAPVAAAVASAPVDSASAVAAPIDHPAPEAVAPSEPVADVVAAPIAETAPPPPPAPVDVTQDELAPPIPAAAPAAEAPPVAAPPLPAPPIAVAPVPAPADLPPAPPIPGLTETAPLPPIPAAAAIVAQAPIAPLSGPAAPSIPDVATIEAPPASVEAREQLDALATSFGAPAGAQAPSPVAPAPPLATPPVPPIAPAFNLDAAPPVPPAGLTTPASPPPAAPLGPAIPPSPVGAPPVPGAPDGALAKARSIFDSADQAAPATPSLGEASGIGGITDGLPFSPSSIPTPPPPPGMNGVGAVAGMGAAGAAAATVGGSIDASDIAKQLANLSPKAAEAIKASTGLGGDE